MTMTNRILPVALVAALIGGSVGAFVMHSSSSGNAEANKAALETTSNPNSAGVQNAGTIVPSEFDTASEQGAYKTGFADGFGAAQGSVTGNQIAPVVATTQPRVVYRNTGSSARRSQQSSRRVYYDYQQQPKGRSFWQKHRDKLTVAMGAGGGAVIGGLIGGKKGAAIGALGGGGGSALYTYKLRKKNRNY